MMVLKLDLSLKVFLVLVVKSHTCNLMKGHIETHDVNCNIQSCKDLFKCVNPLGWIFDVSMSLGDRKVIESCTSLKNMFEDSA